MKRHLRNPRGRHSRRRLPAVGPMGQNRRHACHQGALSFRRFRGARMSSRLCFNRSFPLTCRFRRRCVFLNSFSGRSSKPAYPVLPEKNSLSRAGAHQMRRLRCSRRRQSSRRRTGRRPFPISEWQTLLRSPIRLYPGRRRPPCRFVPLCRRRFVPRKRWRSTPCRAIRRTSLHCIPTRLRLYLSFRCPLATNWRRRRYRRMPREAVRYQRPAAVPALPHRPAVRDQDKTRAMGLPRDRRGEHPALEAPAPASRTETVLERRRERRQVEWQEAGAPAR